MTDKTLAWHWLPDNGCLRHPPHTKVEVGQTLTAEGPRPLELGKNGMHASLRALDALQYAPGSIVCLVELSGELVKSDNKLCARHRKVIAMADATKTLHEFACWSAEQALLREREAGREPDARSWTAIGVKRRWLKGEATDEELHAACAAAWDAVSAAAWAWAWDAVSAAARTAAWDAARTAAWAAARDAAWDVAWNVANAAAWTLARATQNAKLEEMLNALLEEVEGK